MEWINKSKTRNGNFKGQVVIKLTRDEKAFSIRFMKSSYKKITNNNYIVCGLEQSRLYFKQEDPRLGYKLSQNDQDDTARFFKILVKNINFNKIDCGEYNLEYDADLRLWYIDTKHKLDKVNWTYKFGGK